MSSNPSQGQSQPRPQGRPPQRQQGNAVHDDPRGRGLDDDLDDDLDDAAGDPRPDTDAAASGRT